MKRKILLVSMLTAVMVLALAAPAFAERLGGYWRSTLSVSATGSNAGKAGGIAVNGFLSATINPNTNLPATSYAAGATAVMGDAGLTYAWGSPHEDYTTTSGKCKVCHAVHGAGTYVTGITDGVRTYTGTDGVITTRTGQLEGSGGVVTERLLRSTKEDACKFCHVGSKAFADADPYTADGLPNTDSLANYENPNSAGLAAGIASGKYPAGTVLPAIRSGHWSEHEELATGYAGCVSCHSVHGGGTIPNSKILKVDPAKDVVSYAPVNGGYGSIKDPAANQHQFCEDCHNGINYTPVGGGTPVELTSTLEFRAQFPNCSCHDSAQVNGTDNRAQLGAGFFTAHDSRSHIMTRDLTDAGGTQIAWKYTAAQSEGASKSNNGCNFCHNSAQFPHYSYDSLELINGYVSQTQIDKVCLSCHTQSGGNSGPTNPGVGNTY